jgi:hypothetical protein
MAIIMAVAAFVALRGLRHGVQEDTADAAAAGTHANVVITAGDSYRMRGARARKGNTLNKT